MSWFLRLRLVSIPTAAGSAMMAWWSRAVVRCSRRNRLHTAVGRFASNHLIPTKSVPTPSVVSS
jgi:hypothetical protein